MTKEELKKEAFKYYNDHGYPEYLEEMEKMAEHFYKLGAGQTKVQLLEWAKKKMKTDNPFYHTAIVEVIEEIEEIG